MCLSYQPQDKWVVIYPEYGTSTCLTPYLPKLVKYPGWKVHSYKLANSIFDGPIITLLLILYILVEVLSHAHAKRGKSLNGFKFGTSIGRFSEWRCCKHGSERVNHRIGFRCSPLTIDCVPSPTIITLRQKLQAQLACNMSWTPRYSSRLLRNQMFLSKDLLYC